MAKTYRNSSPVDYLNPTGQRALERRQARAIARHAMQRGNYERLSK